MPRQPPLFFMLGYLRPNGRQSMGSFKYSAALLLIPGQFFSVKKGGIDAISLSFASPPLFMVLRGPIMTNCHQSVGGFQYLTVFSLKEGVLVKISLRFT